MVLLGRLGRGFWPHQFCLCPRRLQRNHLARQPHW